MTNSKPSSPRRPDSEATAGCGNAASDTATEALLRAEIATLQTELEQLRAAEQERDRLARILEASPDFIGIATPDGKPIFVNPAGQRILGHAPDGEPLQDTIERIHPPWATQLIVEHGIPAAIREGTWQGESALLDASGKEHPVSQVIVAHRNEHGEVLYLSTIMRDIRELKETESALVRSEQRYRTLVDTSPDAIFINQGGLFTYLNRAAVKLFGARSAQDLIGMPCLDRIHPEDHEAVRERIRLLTEERRTAPLMEQRYLRLDGSVVDVEVTAAPYSDDEESGMQVMVRDITERKAAAHAMSALHRELEERVQTRTAELHRALVEAERANTAKSDFLSRMSHELRTPLNAIIGFGQLLEQDIQDAEQIDSVQEILHAGHHLLDLINEILDLSRIESGKLTLSLEPVQLSPLLSECLVLMRPLAQARSITLSAADTACTLRLRADRVRLKQVLLNLLSNAVKYNTEGGEVTVGCKRDGQSVRIEVTDTGPGIRTEHLDRLFMPFERLGAELEAIEGTGIGLALSKRLVELMGGEIGVCTSSGQGSVFWILLPREEDDCTEAESGYPASVDGRNVPPDDPICDKVLCIEDNPANLRLIERILARRPELEVLTAGTPGLGLDLAQAHRPKLILLDINLPELDGYDVLKCLREHPDTESIPVIAVSANVMPRDLARAASAGFAEYVTKPIEVDRLLSVIDKLLSVATERS